VARIVCLLRRGGPRDAAPHLRKQDLIYVGGGNVISMLGAWRANGIDEALREAWEAGVLLCGLSAGSLCWFTEALTAFDGDPTIVQGLGLLPHSNCVHYTNEPERRVEYTRFVGDGMAPGYAADDGAALHFRGTALHRVVTSRPGAKAYRVEHDGERVVERELDAAFLGAQVAAAA
jgi:dipeptidase E